jgi:outer membrane protein assembly factor BamB
MARRFLVAAALIAAGCACSPVCAMQNELIPETTAARHGLARPWFAQVELDQARGRLASVVLYEGVLYAQTNTANVHAIDAETGKTLWSKQIGMPNHPSMPPDAKGDMLAVVNGSRLFVVNRFNGSLLYEKEIRDAPGNGPALSSKRAYVPSVGGMMMAYQVQSTDETTKTPAKSKTELTVPVKAQTEAAREENVRVKQKITPPLFCQSFGQALVQPLVTRDDLGAEYVVWPTNRGYLNFGRIDRTGEGTLAVKYRLQTGGAIVARPTYLPPDPKSLGDAGVVFAASCDGFLYAVQEETGDTLWRFSTGEPIEQSAAVIDDHVYVTTQLGTMYCLDTKTGRSLWSAENTMRFAAASKARVYAADSTGRLLVFNANNGARLDTIPTERISSILANYDTDRIYLISDGGMVQCLHEIEQTEPFMHNKERKDAAKAGLKPPEPKKEVTEEKPKEHAAPKAPAAPRERPAAKERPKKELKPKTKGSKKKAGDQGDNPGAKKGAKSSKYKKKKKDDATF